MASASIQTASYRFLLLAVVACALLGGGHAQTTATTAPNNNSNNADDTPVTTLSVSSDAFFRLVLRPTPFKLDFVALSIVEEAMKTTIIESTDSSLVNVKIRMQDNHWLSPNGDNADIDGTVVALGEDDKATTVLPFKANGTFLSRGLASEAPGSLALLIALNDIITRAFRGENSFVFVDLVRNSGDILLQDIQEVTVIPTNDIGAPPVDTVNDVNEEDEPEDDAPSITWVEGIIIGCALFVCVATVFMLWLTFNGRDSYEENRRLARRRQENVETNSAYNHQAAEGEDRSKQSRDVSGIESIKSLDTSAARDGSEPTIAEFQPSPAQSSMYTSNEDLSFATKISLPPSPTDINTHLNSRRHRYSSKVRISIEKIPSDSQSLPAAVAKPMTSNSSLQSLDDRSECKSTGALSTALTNAIASEFGPINWFRKSSAFSTVLLDQGDSIDEGKEEEEDISRTGKNSVTSSSSGSNSDVFRVGTITTSIITTGSVVNGGDTVASKASSVVTDWMRTIQVVNSEEESKSPSGVTVKESSSEQSSVEQSSSVGISSSEDEDENDIEMASLEHSMADSKVQFPGIMATEDDLRMEV